MPIDLEYLINSNVDYIYVNAVDFIVQNYQKRITLNDLSRHCRCSTSYVSRILNHRNKMSINAYVNKLRIDKAKTYLGSTQYNITEIAYMVGFDDSNYFATVFRKICGTTPSNYGKKGYTEKDSGNLKYAARV